MSSQLWGFSCLSHDSFEILLFWESLDWSNSVNNFQLRYKSSFPGISLAQWGWAGSLLHPWGDQWKAVGVGSPSCPLPWSQCVGSAASLVVPGWCVALFRNHTLAKCVLSCSEVLWPAAVVMKAREQVQTLLSTQALACTLSYLFWFMGTLSTWVLSFLWSLGCQILIGTTVIFCYNYEQIHYLSISGVDKW